MPNKKYYVVWKGRKPGIYSSWNSCKRQIEKFEGAQYKSFTKLEDAEVAFSKKYEDFKGKNTKKKTLSADELKKYGSPILESISVDAACSGNPGKMEYRGVLTHNSKEIFRKGPYERGTNNIGEFLALVHAISLLKLKNNSTTPIYSDSKIAMNWVKRKKCNTNIYFDNSNKDLLDLIKRAEKWLNNNTYKNPIMKWETKAWGEIPADFGRK